MSASATDDFSIRACHGCGLGFTAPIPSPASAARLYEARQSADYDGEGGRLVSSVKDILARLFVRRLSRGRVVHRVLDYSTGNGRYAVAAAHQLPNAKIVGTDVQTEPPPAITDARTVEYVSTSDFWADTNCGQFDLIIVRHVLEHVYDPQDHLVRLRDRLASGGAIYIEVPNLACAWAPLVGKYFPGYYAPFHVHHFDRSSLSRLLARATMQGEVRSGHMPMIGNLLSRRWRLQETFLIKLFGISLFPLQVAVERLFGRASVIRVLAERA